MAPGLPGLLADFKRELALVAPGGDVLHGHAIGEGPAEVLGPDGATTGAGDGIEDGLDVPQGSYLVTATGSASVSSLMTAASRVDTTLAPQLKCFIAKGDNNPVGALDRVTVDFGALENHETLAVTDSVTLDYPSRIDFDCTWLNPLVPGIVSPQVDGGASITAIKVKLNEGDMEE